MILRSLLLAAIVEYSCFAGPEWRGVGTKQITPHDSYSSSVGVLGCKINTNRVAYWPERVDCNNLCVRLRYDGRETYLLRIDQSGGSHDISYDAWNYLGFNATATVDPNYGGAISMDYEDVSMNYCKDLLHTGKLPLSAPTGMNYLTSCLGDKSSWVASNYELYNIYNSACTLGYDEKCTLDLRDSNQASCPHPLGLQQKLEGLAVTNIEYGTGRLITAN